MTVKTHTFRRADGEKVRHEIVFGSEVDGFVEDGAEPLALFINDMGGPRDAMEAALHEPLHALEPHMTEQRVDRIASELARFLWRLGYRRQRSI